MIGLRGLLAALVATLGLAAAAPPATARPMVRTRTTAGKSAKPVAVKPRHDGSQARVAINHLGDLRPGREVVGRREEPLTAEEETAKQIEKLLRGPLRFGITGLFVADARTGEALFAVNADQALNPASNVKMISTATALELLGAEFHYSTRLLAGTPDHGVVRGDAYLLGTYDPTLTLTDLDDIAAAVAARGVTRIDGSLVVGPDPSRDGVYRAVVPVEIRAGEPGTPPIATAPATMDLVTTKVTATTLSTPGRPRLTYKLESSTDAAGHPRLQLAIAGTIGRGAATTYPLVTRERTAAAADGLRAALRSHGVAVGGDFKTAELGDFLAQAIADGNVPTELGRHDSARLAEIIAHINKWSINWLADRVIMTAAALVERQPPSMELALAAMYDWLGRHPRIARSDLVVDTGSGLSYHTRISPHELVSIVRSAGGFTPDGDAALAHAWLDSLSIAGTDGTLSSRFRGGETRGRIRGKTGTLSTVIALSGVLEADPQRPLAFSLVTNGDVPLSSRYVRRAHEQLVGLLCRYLARTQKTPGLTPAQVPQAALPALPPGDMERSELDDAESSSAVDPGLGAAIDAVPSTPLPVPLDDAGATPVD